MTASSPPPEWLTDIVPLPAARDVHPVVRARALRMYVDPAAAAQQAQWDEKALALFRGTTGPVDLMAMSGEVYARANFNRVLDGKPLVHHLIDRRDSDALLMLIAGNTETGPMIFREDTDAQGLPPLEYAISQGWDDGVAFLERYGFTRRPENAYKPVNNHQTRVDLIARRAVEALQADESDILRAALALGADPNAMRQSMSLLHLAALELKTPMVQAFIAAGADVRRRHSRGETTLQLMWWCHAPKPLSPAWRETVAALRAAGADPTDFKLPEEMRDAELGQPLPGAPSGASMLEMALRASDYKTYQRGLAVLGAQLSDHLTTSSAVLSQSPLEYLCFADRLDVAFDPVVWHGQTPASMRRTWQTIAAQAAKPNRYRGDRPCTFTAADFGAAHTRLQQAGLAARARRDLRL